MDKINLIFKELIVDKKADFQNWIDNYVDFINDIEIVKNGLLEGKSIDDTTLYNNTKTIIEKNYNGFLKKLIVENSNGIASDKISTNMIKGVFQKLSTDKNFEGFLKRIFIDEDKSKAYSDIRNFWKEFSKQNGINFYPSIINRLVAAIQYEFVGTTINESHYDSAEFQFKKNGDYRYDKNKNWYDRNMELMMWIHEKLSQDLEKIDPDKKRQLAYRNIFVWEIYWTGTVNLFSFNKQIILYGAPGTGKTFTCIKDTSYHFEYWKLSYDKNNLHSIDKYREVIQFHPSYTYEDFIEGLRPVVDPMTNTTVLKLVNGVFKNFCKKAYIWENDIYHAYPDAKREEWENITIGNVIDKVEGEHWNFLKNVTNRDELLHNVIPPFYFIIDEINRGELSRIFGELMFCLEYRGYKGKTKTQYAQLASDKDTSYLLENGENYFYVPNNLYILGTMNTIDRSIESFDFALRRRFRWNEIETNYDLIKEHNKEHDCSNFDPLIENLKELNKSISEERMLGKDYKIGHSYFMKITGEIANLRKSEYRDFLWNNSILPLLEEYLRGTSEPKEIANKLTNYKEKFYKRIK